MSVFMENTQFPLRTILVLEPYDITWLGVQQMLHSTLGNSISLIRLSETARLADAAQRYQADAVLLSAIGHRTEVLPLLQQLSLLMRATRPVHIAAYLRNEMPHLQDLLLAFGVNTVFRGPLAAPELARHLMPAYPNTQTARLTYQERNVAQALLAGQSVTRVAQLMHKDIRTISAHKQSLLGKLNMAGRGELQLLGGRLMAGGVSA